MMSLQPTQPACTAASGASPLGDALSALGWSLGSSCPISPAWSDKGKKDESRMVLHMDPSYLW